MAMTVAAQSLPAGIVASAGARDMTGGDLTSVREFCDGSLWSAAELPSDAWCELGFGSETTVGWLDLWLTLASPDVEPPLVERRIGDAWEQAAVGEMRSYAGARVLRLELKQPAACSGLRARLPGAGKLQVAEMIPYAGRPFDAAGKVAIETGVESKPTPGLVKNCFSIVDLPESAAPAGASGGKESATLRNGFLEVKAAREDDSVVIEFVNLLDGSVTGCEAQELLRIETRDLDKWELSGDDELTTEEWAAELGGITTGEDIAGFVVRMKSENMEVDLHLELGRGEHFVRIRPVVRVAGDGYDAFIHSARVVNLEQRNAGRAIFFGLELPRAGGVAGFQPQDDKKGMRVLEYFPGVTVKAGEAWEAASMALGAMRPEPARQYWAREYYRIVSPIRAWALSRHNAWASEVPRTELNREFAAMLAAAGLRVLDSLNFSVGPSWKAVPADLIGHKGWEQAVDEIKAGGMPVCAWMSCSNPEECFLCPNRRKWMDDLVTLAGDYKFANLELDFYQGAKACSKKGMTGPDGVSSEHGHPFHPTGLYAPYWNNRALLGLLSRLREELPALTVVGHCGLGVDPQILRSLDVGHTGADWMPFYNGGLLPEPQEERRMAIWSFSYAMSGISRSYPSFRLFTVAGRYASCKGKNYEYDRAAWEDGLAVASMLSPAIAVYGPPRGTKADDLAAMRRWIEWAEGNKDVMQQLEPVFNETGICAGGGNARITDVDTLVAARQIRNNRGFLLLYNPAHRRQTGLLRFDLDVAVNLRERYPLDAQLGSVEAGGALEVALEPKSARLIELSPEALDAGNLARQPGWEAQTLAQWRVEPPVGGNVVLSTSFKLNAGELAHSRYVQALLRNMNDETLQPPRPLKISVNGAPAALFAGDEFTAEIFGRNPDNTLPDWVTYGAYADVNLNNMMGRWYIAVLPAAGLKAGENLLTVEVPDEEGTVFYGCRLGRCWWTPPAE